LVTVVSAFGADRGADAAALIFEYMAATQAETAKPVPREIDELPAVLQQECRNLPAVYRLPGALLIADDDGDPAGCVGLAPFAGARGAAEIKRLYVRPAFRRQGIAGLLMRRAHQHAACHDLTRIVLGVLPARTAVISFYRSLGYTEIERAVAESPVPMIYMQRSITNADSQP
jgi:ribosomal protein S18 acetylase RimI-like enzyme